MVSTWSCETTGWSCGGPGGIEESRGGSRFVSLSSRTADGLGRTAHMRQATQYMALHVAEREVRAEGRRAKRHASCAEAVIVRSRGCIQRAVRIPAVRGGNLFQCPHIHSPPTLSQAMGARCSAGAVRASACRRAEPGWQMLGEMKMRHVGACGAGGGEDVRWAVEFESVPVAIQSDGRGVHEGVC